MMNLRKELENDSSTVLLILNVQQYFEGIVKVMELFCNDLALPGIYVTVNKPYGTLQELLRDRSIDTSQLYFIDAVSQTVTQPRLVNRNVTYLPNPQSLTEISLAVDTAAEQLPAGRKFLVLDSLSTLLIYNDTNTVAKFAHFLTMKMRAANTRGILVALRHMMDEELIFDVAQYCDKVIDLSAELIDIT
jgi:KaiC/GvpD/RAD55 family RecA-like ATPase